MFQIFLVTMHSGTWQVAVGLSPSDILPCNVKIHFFTVQSACEDLPLKAIASVTLRSSADSYRDSSVLIVSFAASKRLRYIAI